MLISVTGGGIETILIGTKTLISDTCKPSHRTKCLAVNESVRTFAQVLGFSLSGALINSLGSAPICFGCMGTFIVLSVHCLLLQESRAKPVPQYDSYSKLFRFYNYSHPRYSTEKKRARLSICLSILGRLSFSAPANLFVIYLISEPFNFSATLIGAFLGYKTLALSVICLLYTIIPSYLLKTIKDTHMIAAGLSFLALSYIVFMVSTSTVTLFLGGTLYGMFGLAAISFNSILSKYVPESQLAYWFSITTGAERLLICLTIPAISATYQETKLWPVHGFCFIIPLVLTLTSGIVLAVYWKQFSNQTKTVLTECLPLCRYQCNRAGYNSCGKFYAEEQNKFIKSK